MNATLQCLLHVSELTVYFLREYPNDKKNLNEKNKLIESHGQLSNAFYELVKGVCEDEYKIKKNLNIAKLHNSVDDSNYSGSHKGIDKAEPILSSSNTVISHSSFSPYNFKKTLGIYNPQFKKFEANDSKDLILYLMQTMHEELNYFGGNPSTNLSRPNQYDKVNTFMYFMNSYNALNFSIISNIFYGTYENATLCHKCNKLLFNYQKFEFISFGMFDYKNKVFDIYNGFEDNSKPQQLRGENQFYCNTCKNLEDAEITSKIIQPPNKLLINIDYGKNKAFKPSQVKFDEIIDITKYICFDFGAPIKYKIMGVCTHLGSSGSYGHYIAYCKHRETGEWFNFNDSSCRKCYKDDIYGGSPYLLLYEKL
jgi:ubiquitin C-terminal hydrolase